MTGLTSWAKSTFGRSSKPETVTGTSAFRPASDRASAPWPSATGRTWPDLLTSTTPEAGLISTIRVTSIRSPDSSWPVTSNWA